MQSLRTLLKHNGEAPRGWGSLIFTSYIGYAFFVGGGVGKGAQIKKIHFLVFKKMNIFPCAEIFVGILGLLLK